MQHISRHGTRLSSLCRTSGAQLAEHAVSQPAVTGHTAHNAHAQLPCMSSWFLSQNVQQPGAFFSSEAGAEQEAAQAPSEQDFAKLSLQQKKAMLKPEKGRNQFKRMWKKNTQIRNTHKTRIEQQARANEEKHKKYLARWSQGAALWQGQPSEQGL